MSDTEAEKLRDEKSRNTPVGDRAGGPEGWHDVNRRRVLQRASHTDVVADARRTLPPGLRGMWRARSLGKHTPFRGGRGGEKGKWTRAIALLSTRRRGLEGVYGRGRCRARAWKGRGCEEVARRGRDDEGGEARGAEARGGKGKGRRRDRDTTATGERNMRDEEKQARREIERSTIFGEVLEQLGSDASEDELCDALVERGYWNEEESEAVIQRECVREVRELLDEIAREREHDGG